VEVRQRPLAFLLVEKAIDRGTQWAVFEPNDEPLCARVRQSVSDFRLTIWREGALAGAAGPRSILLTCDHTTMTPTDIKDGRATCEIGIAPSPRDCV
jgi:phage tail sheath protein FI